MTDLYFSFRPFSPEQFARMILERYYSLSGVRFLRSPAGKPYIPGNPVCFSLSHSRDLTLLAVSPEETGADCEWLGGKLRPAVLSRFPDPEKAEIRSDRDFLFHWTVREAYVKYLGSTLAALWRRTEYSGGKIRVDGRETGVSPVLFEWKGYAVCLCPGEAGGITEI